MFTGIGAVRHAPRVLEPAQIFAARRRRQANLLSAQMMHRTGQAGMGEYFAANGLGADDVAATGTATTDWYKAPAVLVIGGVVAGIFVGRLTK